MMTKENKFITIKFPDMEFVRNAIKDCQEKNHIQQVAFSTYHDALTQICFGCRKIRTNIE